MPPSLFLFDIAGTTVRDDGLVLRAYHRVLADTGLHATDDWLKARMGHAKPAVFADLLAAGRRPDADAEHLADRFEHAMADLVANAAPEPLPGAEATLAALHHRAVRTGFVTGFSRATAITILDRLEWPRDLLVASDEVPRGRPAPDLILEAMRRAGVTDPARVGVAGDTPADLLAGAAAGCALIIGVGHGTHTLAELAPHPHTHLLDDLTTLPAIIDAA